ncbi:helix-hairpin-helix domain-containing protein [Comamonas squillarum]|uniref:Helix-hairpin-helix domain-containing protein n=1 Tax=Comamonas squillarum TaxID=2977320 RepID=A0ABY6A2X3_9BURK|nr:helix-hairpin-helix domain-containing protein [Comamonas sp. PR12]UXC18571.1 helix-hairpin-helix domain-containing protein [Comamonas sp. PR12]
MMLSMQHDSQPETPLGDVLQPRVKRILERNGIHTVEALRSAYPHQLVKMWGLGMYRFRTIEKAFFPGKSFTPARVYSPVRHIHGSSLNGALDPSIVMALLSAGITTPEQLKAVTPAALLKIKGLGVNRLREIERAFFPGQHYEIPRVRKQAAVDDAA